MSWDDVSDLSINKVIKEIEKSKRRAEWVEWNVSNGMAEADAAALIDHPDTIYTIQVPDYCDSWADMGPIIYQHSISLVLDGDYNTAVNNFECFSGEGGGFAGDYEYEHASPLRAAAIVYLMMNGIGWEGLV